MSMPPLRVKPCGCCNRYTNLLKMSHRNWCQECEREFLRVEKIRRVPLPDPNKHGKPRT